MRVSAGLDEQSLILRAWPSEDGSVLQVSNPDIGSSALKVSIQGGCLAVGLVNEVGFGPIVMTPGFRSRLDISFLAEGAATRAAQRYLNPSGLRTPVALATPRDAKVADILGAIGAPLVEHAAALWDQTDLLSSGAFGFVAEKFRMPVEALLGAHYLLRFLPDRLRLVWADNRSSAYPEVADGSVIAAWLRLSGRGPDVTTLAPAQLAADVKKLLRTALRRRVVLFARTRALLADGLRLHADVLGDAADPSTYLNYGAHAGGLEAFWGYGSESPGPGPVVAAASRSFTDLAKVVLRGGVFVRRSDSGAPPGGPVSQGR